MLPGFTLLLTAAVCAAQLRANSAIAEAFGASSMNPVVHVALRGPVALAAQVRACVRARVRPLPWTDRGCSMLPQSASMLSYIRNNLISQQVIGLHGCAVMLYPTQLAGSGRWRVSSPA